MGSGPDLKPRKRRKATPEELEARFQKRRAKLLALEATADAAAAAKGGGGEEEEEGKKDPSTADPTNVDRPQPATAGEKELNDTTTADTAGRKEGTTLPEDGDGYADKIDDFNYDSISNNNDPTAVSASSNAYCAKNSSMRKYLGKILERLQKESSKNFPSASSSQKEEGDEDEKWLHAWLKNRQNKFWIRKEKAELISQKLGIEYDRSEHLTYRDVYIWIPEMQFGEEYLPCCCTCGRQRYVTVHNYCSNLTRNHYARYVVGLHTQYYIMTRRYYCSACRRENNRRKEMAKSAGSQTHEKIQYTFMGWNERSLSSIFPVLPVYLTQYHTRWERNRRMEDIAEKKRIAREQQQQRKLQQKQSPTQQNKQHRMPTEDMSDEVTSDDDDEEGESNDSVAADSDENDDTCNDDGGGDDITNYGTDTVTAAAIPAGKSDEERAANYFAVMGNSDKAGRGNNNGCDTAAVASGKNAAATRLPVIGWPHTIWPTGDNKKRKIGERSEDVRPRQPRRCMLCVTGEQKGHKIPKTAPERCPGRVCRANCEYFTLDGEPKPLCKLCFVGEEKGQRAAPSICAGIGCAANCTYFTMDGEPKLNKYQRSNGSAVGAAAAAAATAPSINNNTNSGGSDTYGTGWQQQYGWPHAKPPPTMPTDSTGAVLQHHMYLAGAESSYPIKREPGQRSRDKKPRKLRRCKLCLASQQKGHEIPKTAPGSCPGRVCRKNCIYFTVDGQPKLSKYQIPNPSSTGGIANAAATTVDHEPKPRCKHCLAGQRKGHKAPHYCPGNGSNCNFFTVNGEPKVKIM